ncbi:MAG: hypothetical protein PHI16_01565 [Methanocellales archaeon]|nr:hypothetical protein [Methanocellales archaeon]
MLEMPKQLEVERAVNLLRGFGWSFLKEESEADKVTITFQKELKPVSIETGETSAEK